MAFAGNEPRPDPNEPIQITGLMNYALGEQEVKEIE
jgi:hypothetical protein